MRDCVKDRLRCLGTGVVVGVTLGIWLGASIGQERFQATVAGLERGLEEARARATEVAGCEVVESETWRVFLCPRR